MGTLIHFPFTAEKYDLDNCMECDRFISSGESYLEIPTRINKKAVTKAICSDCEEEFVVSLGLPTFIADFTSL